MFYVLLGVIALLVVAFVLVRVLMPKAPPSDGPLLDGMARARAEREAAEDRLAVTSCRMLVAPDYPFSRLDQDIRSCSMERTTDLGVPEPRAATWKSRTFTITYAYDPRVGLRALEFSGHGEAKYLRNDLLNGCYTPSLEGYKVSEYLESQDPRLLLLGILAAEWIGTGPDHRYYLPKVEKLRAHPDPEIAQEAQRVHAFLQSQAQRPG